MVRRNTRQKGNEMAYMTKDGVAPCGSKAGEFVSNHHAGSEALAVSGETQAEANASQREYLACFAFGPPHATKEYTVQRLEAMGMVGLYLKADRTSPLPDGAVEIPTPPELMEPGAA